MAFDDLQVVERVLKVRQAEESLLAFTEITMPDIKDPGDPRKSAYTVAAHHRFMARIYEEVEAGLRPYTILNAPPAHGKSELGTRRFAAWFVGRNPRKNVIVGTYGEDKAKDFRDEIIAIIDSDEFRQVFPDCWITVKAKDTITLSTGGRIWVVGRGNSITGRHGDLILIDDPIKDAKEARSDIVRADLWQWWTRVISNRRRTDEAPVCVTQTRWTEDDLSGRLGDPSNTFYNKRRAKDVEVINIPAFAEDDDPLGRKPGDPLWPARFSREFLEVMREDDPAGFASLYQGRPAPDDGIFYTRDILDPCEYDRDQFPDVETERLQYYGASDHAVSTSRMNDLTCIIPFAVDRHGIAWVLDDVVWSRMQADVAVEHIIAILKARRALSWYTAKGTIDASIGPFLRRRMAEEQCYVNLQGFMERDDKVQRAHSARARVAQGKIRFPSYAPWWPKAKEQLLKFPNASHADFVDTLSLIGLAVDLIVAGTLREPKRADPKEGTFGHMLAGFRRQVRSSRRPGGW